MTGRAHTRETVASVAQYGLLGGFTAVAAGISAQGLTGFARDSMGLRGAWPYLLFLALDGAAGVCAVLLTRRAARAESALAPRLAVWGLVIASSSFNWTHAPHGPHHSGAREAFGLMPIIAAILFEFTLHELRQRTAGRTDRRLTALRWLHPAERIRVQLRLAADGQVSAETATRYVRVGQAARRLYTLRHALDARDHAAKLGAMTARRIRFAERRAHSALTRAGFADPANAAEVLRQVQVLTLTPELARLNYATPEAAQAAIASMISLSPLATLPPNPKANSGPLGSDADRDSTARSRASMDRIDHQAAGQDGSSDGQLIAAAARIVAEARQRGERLSQKTLGDKLRHEGHRVANHSLRELMTAASSLNAGSRTLTGWPPAREVSPGAAGVSAHVPAAPAIGDYRVNGSRPADATPMRPRRHYLDTSGPPGD